MKRKLPPPEEIDWFTIHEVFYDEDGKLSWTENEIAPVGESIEELRETLERMLKALDKPVLNYDADEIVV